MDPSLDPGRSHPNDPTHADYAVLLRSVSDIAAHAERVGALFCPETGPKSATLKRLIEDETGVHEILDSIQQSHAFLSQY